MKYVIARPGPQLARGAEVTTLARKGQKIFRISRNGLCAATGCGSPGTRKGLRGEGLNEEADARARRVTQECGHAAEADALDELLL